VPRTGAKARDTSPGTSDGGDSVTLKIDGHDVKCTRLSKVLYPETRFTKADVIDYYIRIAPFILPHLKDHPVTLKRYPDGVTGQSYWDKDAPSFTPEWVITFPVPRHAGGPDINYILIQNTATLAWAANVAALELHPFLHRAPEIQSPTSIVFDLDPGNGADIRNCIQVAFLVKDVIEQLGLRLFPKVSGSKGIQLHVPLNTPSTYDITQPFARSVAQLIEKREPRLAVSEMPKEKRVGKVFIDWSQNSDYKTTVGVYSLRAKQQHPFVSMPVTWEELEHALKRKKTERLYFEPKAAVARLQQVGDLFARVAGLKQSLPPDLAQTIEQQNKRKGIAKKALRNYERKRDFSATTEPATSTPRRSAQGSRRRFVIQKHAASRLHYDFRLEIHDVLKSWAVPKGIPYEPGVRRLASATEDHPLEYLDFEGVIPKGQYGGGTVMVWDIGTYEVVEGNYWKGNLEISLKGKKLRGQWNLRRDRMKGQTAWVLEKTGSPKKPISTKKDDKSALSGRTMAQIAQAQDATWQSNRGAVGAVPEPKVEVPGAIIEKSELDKLPRGEAAFIEPMQAKLIDRLPEGDEWDYEAKVDGYRVLIVKDKAVAILSRRNRVLTEQFPAVSSGCTHLQDGTVIDGEIVALDENGRPSFNVLQNRRFHKEAVQFYAFDLLTYDGHSLLSVPLEKRREWLKTALNKATNPVKFSATLDADVDSLVAAAKQSGLEGILAKRRDSRYEPGRRSGSWVKFKLNQDQELVIGGYLPGNRGFDSLLVGYYRKGQLIFCAKVRNGFKEAAGKERVFTRFKGLGTTKCPFDNLPEPANARRGLALTAEAMRLCCWLKPKLVAQIGIREWTPDGHLRHATFLGLRDDKDAREVVREGATSRNG
jgi:bifunctional non-homologous end joining protein LigD